MNKVGRMFKHLTGKPGVDWRAIYLTHDVVMQIFNGESFFTKKDIHVSANAENYDDLYLVERPHEYEEIK